MPAMRIVFLLSVLAAGCTPKCVINNPVNTTWVNVSATDETEILLNFCADGRVTWVYGTSRRRRP